MSTIYYHTGTGNSLWTARTLARELGEGTEVLPMARWRRGLVSTASECVGLVFPVHMWGVPSPILDFLSRLEVPPSTYLFGVAVNAGQVSRTLVQLQEVCAARGLELKSGCSVVLPSNYIPWGGPGPEERQARLHQEARERIKAFAALVRDRKMHPVDRGPFWQRLLFTGMYRMTLGQIPGMDRRFWVDERCNGCGFCAEVCPAANITLEQGKPAWHHRCEQCLACIQWCPRTALQYGPKTPRYPRYHHPEVKAADLLLGHRPEMDPPDARVLDLQEGRA